MFGIGHLRLIRSHFASRTHAMFKLLTIAMLLAACSGEGPAPLKIDRNVPTTAVIGTPYTVKLGFTSGSGSFTTCQFESRHKVTPAGELTWHPFEETTQTLCVLARSDGRTDRMEWQVTARHAPGKAPAELRAKVDAWRAALAGLRASRASCSAETLAAVAAADRPLVVLDARDLSAKPLAASLFDAWRAPGLDVVASTPLAWVTKLLARRHALVVIATSYQRPQMLLGKRFETGHFSGSLNLVDLTTRTTLCGTDLVFRLTPKVESWDGMGGGGPSHYLDRDLLHAGTRALLVAAGKLAPGVEVDLPNMPPEHLQQIRAASR